MGNKLDKNLMYVVMAMLGLAVVNIVLKLANVAMPIVETILLPLGFLGFLAIMYLVNKFEFKTKLDLALMSIIIAVLFFVGTGAPGAIPSSALMTAAVLAGLSPLLIGVVVGGVVTILIGLVRMKK